MQNITFGYCRVSTKEQNESRQIDEMKNQGIDERNIFTDKASGKDFERADYKALLRQLREGDLVVIKSIDRLGRNYSDILEQWRYITQEIKADIRVLDIPLLDTTANSQTLDNRFIADLMLQILCYVSEKERRFIKQRQAEGIALAKKEGRMIGRPKIQKPDNWNEIYIKWVNKEITAIHAMKELNLKTNTFYTFVKAEQQG